MVMKRATLLLAAGGVALAGCTGLDRATDDPNRRTKEGAVTGALLGAVAGALTGEDGGERTRGALIGAAVGAGTGAFVGSRLDKQAAELQAELGSGRIQIINEGDHLVVRMPDDILFAVDSADITPALRDDLRALAANLNRYPDSTVQVIGHTDNTGGTAYNQGLSERRAAAVSNTLVADGVSAGRVQSRGLGETQPIASNDTAVGKASNRRVEVKIFPTEA